MRHPNHVYAKQGIDLSWFGTGGYPLPADADPPCVGRPELFDVPASHPNSDAARLQRREAATHCAVCPWRADCMAYALTHRVEGTWGGRYFRPIRLPRPWS